MVNRSRMVKQGFISLCLWALQTPLSTELAPIFLFMIDHLDTSPAQLDMTHVTC